MPFDINDAINSVTKSIINPTYTNLILTNPVVFGATITIIIIVLIMWYLDIPKIPLKCAGIIFILTVALVWIHDSALLSIDNNNKKINVYDNLIQTGGSEDPELNVDISLDNTNDLLLQE